jgi:hypothetical protein
MTSKKFSLILALAAGTFAACAHPKPKAPPEPTVVQTTPDDFQLAPVHFAPAPTTTAPSPIDPPPEVLHVQDDGHG